MTDPNDMKLGDRQKLFTRLLPKLFEYIHEQGYECTLGDAYRDARSHGKLGERIAYGNKFSCHKVRCAIDINLFKDGKYLTTTNDHHPIGKFWENLHPLCCWGGRFNDGNHYSITYQGMK
jgi:hypothetical protein